MARLISTPITTSSGATVSIRTPEILDGLLPPKQRKLTVAWAELHQAELLANWDLVMSGIHPKPLAPLK